MKNFFNIVFLLSLFVFIITTDGKPHFDRDVIIKLDNQPPRTAERRWIGRKLMSGGRTFDGLCHRVTKYRDVCIKYGRYKVCHSVAVKSIVRCMSKVNKKGNK